MAYPALRAVRDPGAFSPHWPLSLAARISAGLASVIHIPFMQAPLFYALNQFTVNTGTLRGGLNAYDRQTHIGWGLMRSWEQDANYLAD